MAIDWRNEPVIDSVQLPGSETKYWVQDTEAREKIEALASATHFLGVTTTALEDGSNTNPIIINEQEVTAVSGDIAIYKKNIGLQESLSLEFIFDGTYWQLLGGQSIEGAGDLAYKDTAEGNYTPAGSVTLSTTNYDGENIKVVTNINNNLYTYLESSSSGDGNYFLTYVGASDSGSYGSFVYSIIRSTIAAGSETDAGSLPTLTDITVSGLTASISNTTLVLGTGGADVSYSFNSGSFPTYSFASVTNITDINYSSAITSIFTEGAYIQVSLHGDIDVTYSGVTGTFAGSSTTITVS